MEKVIIPLIVALITAIIGPIITLLVKERLEQKKYPTSTNERNERLIGLWKGYFEQVNPYDKSKILKMDFDINLTKKGRIFGGSGTFVSIDSDNVTVILHQGMFDGNLLKIDYENKKKYIFQSGTMVLKMDSKGNKLFGEFVGIAPTNNEIISGKIEALRQG